MCDYSKAPGPGPEKRRGAGGVWMPRILRLGEAGCRNQFSD